MEVEITLSDEEKAFVDRRVAEGHYANTGEYVAVLIAADAKRQLISLVQAGTDSPHRELTDAVWTEIRSKAAARLNDLK